LEPAKDFVGAMAPHLAKISPGIQAVPKVGKSIMRINRETRFSKDTTPYKDWLGLWFWEGDGKSRECPGFYFGLGTAGFVIGAGMHRFGPPYLAKYRAAVGDSKFGKALAAAVRKVEKKGYEVGGSHYKKVPRGFAADHPHADLLRHNGLTAGRNVGLVKDLFGPDAAAYCAGVFKDVSPMHHWLTGVMS
jgi:uncharacterized protein (TIGR02453 family)